MNLTCGVSHHFSFPGTVQMLLEVCLTLCLSHTFSLQELHVCARGSRIHQHSNFLTLASSIFIVGHLGRNAMLSDAFRVEILDGDLDGLAVGDHVVLEAWRFFPGVFAKFVKIFFRGVRYCFNSDLIFKKYF